MPEYLAPGVYVEETSFRAKSIEGVSTSTTGFVGLTRKGPIGETPELLTSFGDFERIYGGVDNLTVGSNNGLNYLAHAVANYFDEGGKRLYVSRVYLPPEEVDPTASERERENQRGKATSGLVVTGASADSQAYFVARFPGDAGNGWITVREVSSPAIALTMTRAPLGTLLRVGGEGAPTPAEMEGGAPPPFRLTDGGRLLLTVGGTDVEITFRGQPAEATAFEELADEVEISADSVLQVTIGATSQTIELPEGTLAREDLLALINAEISGGYAGLTDDDWLVIGSDRRGSTSSVRVAANEDLGFTAEASHSNTADANNNVADLYRVTVEEIDALLVDGSIALRASSAPASGNLLLSTSDTGAGATLVVREGDDSVHKILGLKAGPGEPGKEGAEITYWLRQGDGWVDAVGTSQALDFGLEESAAPTGGAEFLTLNVVAQDKDGNARIYEDTGFDPSHPRYVGSLLAENPARRFDHLENMYALRIGSAVDPFQLRNYLFSGNKEENTFSLTGGSDGLPPTSDACKAALKHLESLEDVSIVAAPGSSAYASHEAVQRELIKHVERRRAYRISVLETRPGQSPGEARQARSRVDSKYAALYYPWVTVANPLARPGVETIPREINLPPSGFICGIYARNDVERGVHKAPANEVVRSALRYETDINFAEQEMLNPLGVNCLRYFPGRGYRVWGARTVSSDPEWKYVPVRRYLNYLEASIDRGTQWAVFEPNGPRLWSNVRETVSSFLYNEWRNGALLGATPEEAYFVRCDRSTMTQNDLDSGRMVCLIGVAVLTPAEFVIFRIGQKTADTRS